eukprot:TRINITY_DN1167_c0_g2_i1.p1 TRINITY_DN1167_c0_g2~~TRINITY_DN1167_c0_g2_i1.p1  ORF type:complete len:234 (-),score=40.56 TRINITY_DN1167_c0_g2_i1:110-811(-)
MQTIKHIVNRVTSAGFAICEPFNVFDYNALVSAKIRIQTEKEDCVGLVVGSTKTIFSYFVEYIKENNITKDPVDNFDKIVLRECIQDVDDCFIIFSSDSPRSGRFAHIQTAGHVAGVAYYDKESYWSVHPEYGMWFIYKAVVIFPNISYSDCYDIPREIPDPVLTEQEKTQIVTLTKKAMNESWTNIGTLLEIRDVCEVGREWRYDGLMLDYFYPVGTTKAQVLEKILQGDNL